MRLGQTDRVLHKRYQGEGVNGKEGKESGKCNDPSRTPLPSSCASRFDIDMVVEIILRAGAGARAGQQFLGSFLSRFRFGWVVAVHIGLHWIGELPRWVGGCIDVPYKSK